MSDTKASAPALRARLHALRSRLPAPARDALWWAIRGARHVRSLTRPWPSPQVIVLGNQKSGTTAIANLLAEAAQLSVTLDIHAEIRFGLLDDLARSTSPDMQRLLRSYRQELMRHVVKEPELTWHASALQRALPEAAFVGIVRHPLENIRSIYDRIGLSGRAASLQEAERLSVAWRRICDVSWHPDVTTSHPALMLAHRWRLHLEAMHACDRALIMQRYEDFNDAPQAAISALCKALGLPAQPLPDRSLHRSYQPRGATRGIAPEDFFGSELVGAIWDVCGEAAAALGYTPSGGA